MLSMHITTSHLVCQMGKSVNSLKITVTAKYNNIIVYLPGWAFSGLVTEEGGEAKSLPP